MPSAGCVFQNPERGRDVVPDGMPWSAGALVDRAGLKGAAIGGARVSPTHHVATPESRRTSATRHQIPVTDDSPIVDVVSADKLIWLTHSPGSQAGSQISEGLDGHQMKALRRHGGHP